jgi:hypothetical protein
MDYFPFLKVKQNEMMALSLVKTETLDFLTPVLDLPRPKDLDENGTLKAIDTSKRQFDRYFPESKHFYLDVFDLDPTVKIQGQDLYSWTLGIFDSDFLIPVIGLDRDQDHINAAFNFLQTGAHTRGLGLRLLPEDFDDFELIEDDIEDLVSSFPQELEFLDVIIDCRIIDMDRVPALSESIRSFLTSFAESYSFRRVIIASSSVLPVASEMVATESEKNIARCEKHLWQSVKASCKSIVGSAMFYGDYTVVSPHYSDPKISASLLPSITAPRAYYTYDIGYYAIRGGAFKTHPRKRKQYQDIANEIIRKPFFRGATFSVGDDYIEQSASGKVPKGSPGSWVKNTVICHIEFAKHEFDNGLISI